MNRRRFLLFGALVVVLFGGVAVWVFRPRSPINRENFERIHVGMTYEEVEDLIGLPPGDHARGRDGTGILLDEPAMPQTVVRHAKRGPIKNWVGNEGVIWVNVDAEGRVSTKFFSGVHRQDGFSRELRRWLGL